MEWLENWLRDFRGTIIAVSHDRRFLDKMVTSVAELVNGRINTYSCGYEKFLTEREERRARLEAEWEQQKEKIEDMSRYIAAYGTVQKALNRYYGGIATVYLRQVNKNLALETALSMCLYRSGRSPRSSAAPAALAWKQLRPQ